jgi:hypothetical protein
MTRKHDLIPVNSRAEIPVGMTEAEAAEFWDTHEFGPGLFEEPVQRGSAWDQMRRRRAAREAARERERLRVIATELQELVSMVRSMQELLNDRLLPDAERLLRETEEALQRDAS